MSSFSEYDQFDGLGLADLVRKKEISSVEICEEAIRRAEAVNPKINAIIRPLYDLARKTAKDLKPDAPFSGVPFLLKDAHHALKGVAMACGSEALTDFIPEHDAEIVRRFKKAGVVILGKTNTPEFKLAYVTEPKAFGPTRNPWNPEYSSGGSSGGSAAAVAARIVPLASATDEGGSIRVPASYCGLFGLKPSRGRNPVGPDFSEEWDGMSASHVLTHSVRDSAAMLDAVSGPEEGASYTIAKPIRPFLDEINREPGQLRIAFNTESAYGKKVHPECVKAVEETARLLESFGHYVEEAVPSYTEEEVAFNWFIVLMGHVVALIDEIALRYGRTVVTRKIELRNLASYKMGLSLTADEFVQAKHKWLQLGSDMAQFLRTYHMILIPTLGEPPVPVGSQRPGKTDQLTMKLIISWVGKLILGNSRVKKFALNEPIQKLMRGQMPFTLIANITGQPAMSVPLHWTEDGLPCGVQFIGRFGDEASLLRLAAQLEKAQPWFDKKPRSVHST